MPAEGFNFQALVRRLGLKNVDELPIVRAITPVLNVGDAVAQGLVNPLRGAEFWFGQELQPVVGEGGAFQIRALTRDVLCRIWYGSDAPLFFHFRIDETGGDVLGADPLVAFPLGVGNQVCGPIPATSRMFGGTTSVPAGVTTPGFAANAGQGETIDDLYIPIGSVLTFQSDNANQLMLYAVHVKEFVSPDLAPIER